MPTAADFTSRHSGWRKAVALEVSLRRQREADVIRAASRDHHRRSQSHTLGTKKKAPVGRRSENSYRGPVDENLPESKTPRDWFRMLYYRSVVGEDKLNDDPLRSAFDACDSLVRGALYRYLLVCDVSKERFAPFISEWSWNAEMHDMEQTFGSLLLMKLAKEDQSPAPWRRVDPTRLDSAASARVFAFLPDSYWRSRGGPFSSTQLRHGFRIRP